MEVLVDNGLVLAWCCRGRCFGVGEQWDESKLKAYSLTCGAADTTEAKAIAVWPATVAPTAKPALLNGTCTRSSPSDSRNCSPTRCPGVPVPPEAKLYLPGLDLMKPTRSLTVCTGSDG